MFSSHTYIKFYNLYMHKTSYIYIYINLKKFIFHSVPILNRNANHYAIEHLYRFVVFQNPFEKCRPSFSSLLMYLTFSN